MKYSSRALLFIAKLVPRGYWRIIKFAANRDVALQDFSISLHGISHPLRADFRESVFMPLYRGGQIPHQIGFDRICRRILRPDDVVFDVGANMGYTAALFADAVGEGGRVVAIEPSPRSFFLLSRSLAKVRNIELLNLGVSSTESELDFYVTESLDLASFRPTEGASKVTVRTVTVDMISADHGQPSFIKVDVEGHEPRVFDGAAATLAREDRPIIIFEALDDGVLQECIGIITRLGGAGYRFKRIANDGTFVPVENRGGSSDYIAIPKWAEQRLASSVY